MLGAFSIDTYLPSFPSIAAEFHLGVDAVQQTLTVFLLAMAVMTLFHGTLSDAVGRRPVILGSLAIYLAASIYGNHGRFVSGRSRCTFLVPRSDHSDRISRYGRRSSSQCTLRRVLHSCHSLGRCPDHALHVRHGSRIAGHDHSDAGPLSRPARLGRIAPVRFRHGRFFNLFRFAGASPLWECFQAGMRGLSRPSRQRCVLVLWTALQKNCKAFRMTGTSTRAFGSPPAYSTGSDRSQ